MSEQPREALSALMDNEVGDFELRSLLKQSADNDELSGQWQRYHVASSVLKQEQVASGDISASVMAALDEEPALNVASSENTVVKTKSSGINFWKPLASMAVAASVTAVVILGGQNFGVGQPTAVTPDLAQTSVSETTYAQPGLTVPSGFMRAQFGAPRIAQQIDNNEDIIRFNSGLNSYIQQHNVLNNGVLVSSNPGWLPEGFTPVKNALAPGAELTVFSNGEHSFTLSIERTGDVSVPEGATQLGDMVAIGKKVDQFFVTVVGDVPLMVADRVVNSVRKIQ
ncbi:MucB/RseB C-terminal domain-containing protein [Amphritea japonica]|uniref:RNA polymerase sigma factor AlgU n=1 Tax=Amphritea japonica ATCC BAA-1530 TaxID=1278309 RepID=A0A7R6PPY2_9GAMM|nr:MucB/RseB C-terminal domain-containing protein [Amphritea japonica]BBB27373.1 RNA polymerase sigma factor AlgU [Amphritea japonica ATCC BAA-1530]